MTSTKTYHYLKVFILIVLCNLISSEIFAQDTVSDEFTVESTGITKNNAKISNLTLNSGAIYSGTLGYKNTTYFSFPDTHGGFVTTKSAGRIKSVSVKWSTATTTGRVVSLYFSNTPFSGIDDLYQGKSATATLAYGGKAEVMTYEPEDSYQYVGIRSKSGVLYLTNATVEWYDEENMVQFSKDETTFTDKFDLTLSTKNNSRIYYTVDGTKPSDTNGTLYSEPFEIIKTTTVKAIAYYDDDVVSAIKERTYTLNLPQPTLSSTESTFSTPFTLYIQPNSTAAEDILYTLDNTDICIDNIGKGVSRYSELNGEGIPISKTTTIKAASLSYDGNTTGSVLSQSYALSASKFYFNKSDDITFGKRFLIIGNDGNSKNYVMTTTATTASSLKNRLSGSSINIDSSKDYLSYGNDKYTFEAKEYEENVDGETQYFYLYNNATGSYLTYDASVSVYSLILKDGKDSAKGLWYIKDKELFNKESGTKHLLLSLSETTNFAMLATGNDISFYEEADQASFTIGSTGYSTLYIDKGFIMPSNVDGYIVKGKADESNVMIEKAYPEGSEVPSCTPLLLKGTEGSHAYPIVNSNLSANTDNILHGTLENETTHVDETDVYYYKLTTKDGKVGFYWANEDGSAFENQANKAYLALPSSSQSISRGFSLDELEKTSKVNAISLQKGNQNIAYDLYGKPLNPSAKDYSKGILIMNGKKLLKK